MADYFREPDYFREQKPQGMTIDEASALDVADHARRAERQAALRDEPELELGLPEEMQESGPPPAPIFLFEGCEKRQRQPARFADHAKSRNIDALAEPELRAYAREIGMSIRDARDLSVDRLRAGAKSHLIHHINQLLD